MTDFISVADPVAQAQEILEKQLFPLITLRRPHNIPYVVVGPNLPNEVFQLIREACLKRDYEAECLRSRGHPDPAWLINLSYRPPSCGGDTL